MPRILIFSPYSLWSIHTIYEKTIAQACKARGAEVEYLLCDGLLPECDLHWDSKAKTPRPIDLCQRCQAAAKEDVQEHGIPFHWLGDFLRPCTKTEVLEWSHSLSPAEFQSASFQGSPIGQWVLSSVISYFRQYPPDLENGHVADVYRGFLYSAAIVVTSLTNFLTANPIDSSLLFNGRQSITRVAFELFRQRNIPVLTHERAEFQRGHINIRPNAHCMSLNPFGDFWGNWAQVPLKRESLDAARNWLIQRRYGINLAWIQFSKSSQADPSLRKKMNLSQNKRLWALFTSSTDEVAGDPLMKGPYESQLAWVRDVVEWVKLHREVQLVIKVHPNLGGNLYIGKAIDELRIYQEMKPFLPDNVRILMPQDSVSAYALAEEADIGLTFGSTIGLEMAMLGKPVLLASRAIYEHASQILTVRSRESLGLMLEKCMQASTDREIQREAFRLAYYYIFQFELDFPAVTVDDIFEARVNYAKREDLAPGKDSSLDHICSFLTEGRPLFDPPTAAELSRSTADEDVFFDELANLRSCMVHPRLERWIRLQSLAESAKTLLRRLPFGVGKAIMNLGSPRWRAYMKSLETGGAEGPRRGN